MKIKRFKIISIVLLMVFLSQQISWACGYNLSLLVNSPPSSLIYQDHGEFNLWVAKRVYSLTKPSFRHNPQELKSAYQWLKTPSTQTVPCSAYVLYNLLQAKGLKPKIEDISASLISLDLKAGNLKPPFTASRIDNSLYAMAKTAKSQGLELYPSRLNSHTPKLLNSQTPFIAHLSSGGQSGHFVLVTKVSLEKVYFFYDKGDTFLPYEKFLEEFSGYCLLSSISLPPIPDAESKTILGAGRAYHGRSVNISSLFKKPSTMESVIGIASAFGGAFSMGGSGYGSLAAMGIKIGGSMIFKDSQWGQIGTSIVAGAVGGGINGGMSGGWKEGLQGAGVGAAKSATISGTMYGVSKLRIANLSPSVMASIGQLVAVPLGSAVGRGLETGFNLPMYDGSGNRLTGDQLAKAQAGGFGTGFWQGLTFQTPESWGEKVSFREKWGGALQHYGSETASIAVEVFAPGKYSSAYGMGINSAFSVFTNTNDSWGKAVGISIGKGVAMGGASLLLANLTKDMRVTEGAFLEKAASSLIGAGVESIFGYNKAESAGLTPTSRWGIFSKSLTDNWVNTSKSIVTFGNPSGNFLNYQGSYAIAKMYTFGSDIAALQKGGLKGFDAVRYAWNQYVGSSLHYSAINDFSSIAENRMRGVTYANVGKEMHKIELQGLSKFTNDKDFLKSGGRAAYDLTAQEYIPQTFTYDDQTSKIVKSITIGESGLLPADYSKEDAEFLETEQKYFESKINSLNDTKLPQEDFMIRYPMVSEELEKTVVFSPQQKVALRQDLKKVKDDSFSRFLAAEKNSPKNVFEQHMQKQKTLKDAFFSYRKAGISVGMVENSIFAKDATSPVDVKPTDNVFSQYAQEQEALKDASFPYRKAGISAGVVENLVLEQDVLDIHSTKNDITTKEVLGRWGKTNVYEINGETFNNEGDAQKYQEELKSQPNVVNGKAIVKTGDGKEYQVDPAYITKNAGDGWINFKRNDIKVEYQTNDGKTMSGHIDNAYLPAAPNSSSSGAPDVSSPASANSGSTVPEIAEGASKLGRSFHVNDRVFKTYEEAVKYRDTLKTPSGGSPALQSTAIPEPTTSQAVTPTVAPTTIPSPPPVSTPSPADSATAAATASPTVTPAASPTPEPTPTSQLTAQTTPKATGGDYLHDLKLLQNEFEQTFGSVNSSTKIARDRINDKFSLEVAENLPIVEVIRNGAIYYKIEANDKAFESLPQSFRDIEFPSKTLAENVRYLYVGNERREKIAGAFKIIWGHFYDARKALFDYYKAGNN